MIQDTQIYLYRTLQLKIKEKSILLNTKKKWL